jgi:hypothetical protein
MYRRRILVALLATCLMTVPALAQDDVERSTAALAEIVGIVASISTPDATESYRESSKDRQRAMDALVSVDVPPCLHEFWMSTYTWVALMRGAAEVAQAAEELDDPLLALGKLGLARAMLDRANAVALEVQAVGVDAQAECLVSLE